MGQAAVGNVRGLQAHSTSCLAMEGPDAGCAGCTVFIQIPGYRGLMVRSGKVR